MTQYIKCTFFHIMGSAVQTKYNSNISTISHIKKIGKLVNICHWKAPTKKKQTKHTKRKKTIVPTSNFEYKGWNTFLCFLTFLLRWQKKHSNVYEKTVVCYVLQLYKTYTIITTKIKNWHNICKFLKIDWITTPYTNYTNYST